MNDGCQPLLAALADPASMVKLDLTACDRLLRQARQAGLLWRLAAIAQDLGLTDQLPEPLQPHLTAALTVVAQQRRAVAWEARKLDQALAPLVAPVVLLKGAAYVLSGLPPGRGRLFGDIDILVPKPSIGKVEAALRLHGWHGHQHSAYDQRYYRQWMHELPPLVHIRRNSLLDVHHNLLPETARLKTRPEQVLDAARPLAGFEVLRIPRLDDLVLHSATHLFFEGEWDHGLRDLTDLDLLLRYGLAQDGWWDKLIQRAEELNLLSTLALALRYAHRLLDTPVPKEVLRESARHYFKVGWFFRDGLFQRGLLSVHPQCQLRGNWAAGYLLYLRAHRLRMPLHLLLPHLVHKAWLAGPGKVE